MAKVVLNARLIDDIRTRRGLLKKDVAAKAGVAPATLSLVFSGRPVGVRVARGVARALRVPVSALIVSTTAEAGVLAKQEVEPQAGDEAA
ncbi:MAG: helix-turn-helix transcriptional regulator [Phycisphaerae bacterium]|nr:helix-turn-helix transcriptional regulator [Phycisphaerae bacterium]